MQLRHLLAWLTMLLVSILNGALRDSTYGEHLPALHAHQLSTLSDILLLGALIWLYVRRWPPASAREAWHIGLFWMTLTVTFEFLFFHYVGGHPWEVLLANYDLGAGRLWPLILLWIAVAPRLFTYLLQQR